MGKTGSATWENQLLAAKTRMSVGHVEGAFYEAAVRLHNLTSSLSRFHPSGDDEVLRHFPVAVIAVLETHFKATVQAIVDTGSPYLERGLALTKDRLRSVSEIFPILHRRTVTVGDLVAHQLPFNSIGSTEDALSSLLDENFKSLISSARDPYQVRNDLDSPPIVESVDDLWRGLAETFERRHILAHEAASNYIVTYDHAKSAVECATIFTAAVDAVLWSTIWKDEPLTQYEMNVNAQNRYLETRKRFACSLRQALRIAKDHGKLRAFRRLHRNWRNYANGTTKLEEDVFAMGSIRPLIAATVRNRLLGAREQDVVAWISSMQP